MRNMEVRRERIDALLVTRGWTLGQLHIQARRLRPSLSWSSLSEVVNGQRSPTLKLLEVIAQTLETSVGYLVGETDNPDPAPQLVLNEEHASPAPLTREVAQLAARLNRLPAAPRAKIVAAFAAVVELTEGQPLAEATAEAPSAASPEPDPAQRSRTARLLRLLDQLADEEYQRVVGEIDALLAANAATPSPAPAPGRRVAGTRSGG